jgi:hypothetical protein
VEGRQKVLRIAAKILWSLSLWVALGASVASAFADDESKEALKTANEAKALAGSAKSAADTASRTAASATTAATGAATAADRAETNAGLAARGRSMIFDYRSIRASFLGWRDPQVGTKDAL